MAENDYFLGINYGTPWAQQTQANSGCNPQSYLLFDNNKKLSTKDKDYLAQLSADRTKAIASLNEDLYHQQFTTDPKARELAANTIELQKQMISSLEIEMDSVNNPNQQGQGALKKAISECKDPAELNRLLTIMTSYKQHIVDLQENLAKSGSKLSKKERAETEELLKFYKSNVV